MKLFKLMGRIGLFAKIVCVVFLSSVCANSASVAITGTNYSFSAPSAGDPNKWHDGSNELTTNLLKQHLDTIILGSISGTPARATTSQNCIKEIARMLLAQIPGTPGTAGPHNVGGNSVANYIVRPKVGGGYNFDDIHKNCKTLKRHLLIHGHLGFFPIFSHEDHQGVSNRLTARGIFNISHSIVSRVFNNQLSMFKRISNFLYRSWYNRSYFWLPIRVPSSHPMYNSRYPGWIQIDSSSFHLLPNLLSNLEFDVDPEQVGNNLERATDNLINNLLSGNDVQDIEIRLNHGNIVLDVKYDFPNPIPNTTQTKDIGYNPQGNITNNVRIILKVTAGVVQIVSMYPI